MIRDAHLYTFTISVSPPRVTFVRLCHFVRCGELSSGFEPHATEQPHATELASVVTEPALVRSRTESSVC